MALAGKSIYRSLLSIGGYSYSYTIIQFLASTVISRLLVPAEYGIVAMITVFTGFISFFKDAGISYYIIREDYGRVFHRSAQGLSLIIGLCLSGLIAVLAYPISIFYAEPRLFFPTVAMAIVILVEAMTVVPSALISKQLLFNKLGKINFISYTTGSVATIVLAFLNFSYWALIGGQFVAVMMIYVLSQRITNLGTGIFKSHYIKATWKKTSTIIRNISGSRFIQYWSNNADGLIIGKVYGAAPLGFYNRGYQLLTMQLNLITGIFNTVLLPNLKLKKQEGVAALEESFYEALSLMALVVLPITVALALFSAPIVTFIWGSDWLNVATVTPFFGILAITFVISRSFGNIYVLFNKEGLLFKLGLFTSITSVAAIVIGAMFSIPTIAFAFSLNFVTLVLPVILITLFVRAIHFSVMKLLKFWVPKITLSIITLFALYFKFELLLIFSVSLLALHVFWNGKIHIIRMYKLFFNG